MSESTTIYIFDDDQDFCLQQQLQLEATGYAVRCAHDRVAAEALLAEATPDLVIQDLMMDEQDTGFVMCYELKRNHPGLPVIMVTAVGAETGIEFDATTAEERSWIKADRMLAKPVRFEQLRAAIEQLLDAARSRQ